MPIYEYECAKCGHEFEREQRMADPPIKTCPKCKARKVTKLISRSSFVLKGGGWYADGYSDSKKKATSSDSSTPSTSEGTPAVTGKDKPASSDTPRSEPKSEPKSGGDKSKKGSSKSAA